MSFKQSGLVQFRSVRFEVFNLGFGLDLQVLRFFQMWLCRPRVEIR